jgi:hypothetical protein
VLTEQSASLSKQPQPVPLTHSVPALALVQSMQLAPVSPQAARSVPLTQVPLSQHPDEQGAEGLQLVPQTPLAQTWAPGQSLDTLQPQVMLGRQRGPLALPLQSSHRPEVPQARFSEPSEHWPVLPSQQPPLHSESLSQNAQHSPSVHAWPLGHWLALVHWTGAQVVPLQTWPPPHSGVVRQVCRQSLATQVAPLTQALGVLSQAFPMAADLWLQAASRRQSKARFIRASNLLRGRRCSQQTVAAKKKPGGMQRQKEI